MNFAHVHLILNHLPVVGIPVALVFLFFGMKAKNVAIQRLALFVLVALAAFVVPVYLTGEPAEKVVEHMPGFAESFIEPHEDAAMVAMILTLITGALALLTLWVQRVDQQFMGKARKLSFFVLGFACFSTLCLIYTANKGGQIRHTELRAEFQNGAAAPSTDEHDED